MPAFSKNGKSRSGVRKKVPLQDVIEKQFIFTEDTIKDVVEKISQGFSLPRHMNPWFKNQPGVRRTSCVYGWTQHELDEFTKCALDIHYFADTYCHIKGDDGQVRQMKLRDYQYNVLDVYTKNRFVLNISSRQTGKDQPMCSKLWTDNGPIMMGDVKIGTEIYGQDGQLTTVIGIYPQGLKDVYEITFADGSKAQCGLDHLWEIDDTYGNRKVLSLLELKKSYISKHGDYKYYIRACEPVNYSSKALLLDPYLLGVLLGDGGLTQMSVNVASIDNEIIEELEKQAINEDCKLTRADHNSFRFTRNNCAAPNVLKTKLIELNLMGKYSYEKHIPNVYKYASIEQRLALLQGLMDTAGSVSKASTIEFSTSSKILGDDVAELAESLGIIIRRTVKKTSYKNSNGTRIECRLAYRLKFQLRNDYPYKIFRLTRKQELVINKHYDWGKRRGIAKIEMIGNELTQCIEVNNVDHLYLTDHYIPTHNTVMAGITILHYCIFNSNKNCMVVANKHETVIEILDKIKNIYKLLPFFLKPGLINWNSKSIIFDNGCRIKSQARSKEPAIGFSIDFLYLDEFAHIPKTIINHYYKAVVPTVSAIKNSKIIITSTPNGANLFKDLVMGASLPEGHQDKNMYKLVKVYWYQVSEGKFDDGTDGTRFDAKLFPMPYEMASHSITIDKLVTNLRGLNFKVTVDEITTDAGTKEFIRILHKDGVSDIETIRKLDLDGLCVAKYCTITNWKEQETKLIGGEEAFNQEYGIQFLAGSKRVLSATKAKTLENRCVTYQTKEIELLTKRLRFPYNELRWAPDYIEHERNNYYWVTAIDVSEGLGQDDSVINLNRLMVRSNEWLAENKIKTMYDAFYLKQTGIYNFNRIDFKKELPELFYLLHFNYLNPERVKSIVEYNGPGMAFLAAMPGVFDGNNNFGNYMFVRYKHNQEDMLKKIGLKITRNKKALVKGYIDSVEDDKLYVDEAITLDQMDNFIKIETPSGDYTYKADSGHDDIVMTEVHLSTFFETQDYKNMCLSYYTELPKEVQNLIDKAMDLDYNPNAISYKSLSAALSKTKKTLVRNNRFAGGNKRFNL